MPSPLAQIPARELIQLLTAHAVRVFAEYGFAGQDAVVGGVGLSAEDFAGHTYLEYLTGKIKVKELPYLYAALRNDIIDKLGSSAHKTTKHMPPIPEINEDGTPTKSLDSFVTKEPRVDDLLCEESYKLRVLACVENEPKLREVVEAVFDLGLLKPADIANAIGVSAEEVYVRNRKLARRLIKHGLKVQS